MSFARNNTRFRIDAEVLRFLNAKEVARRIGTTPTTVRRWAREQKPGFPQPRRNGEWAEYDIERFIADSKIRGRVAV